MTRRLFSIVVFSLALASLAGCGQSGPLYLPGNPSEVQEPPREPAPDEDEDDEDDEPGRR